MEKIKVALILLFIINGDLIAQKLSFGYDIGLDVVNYKYIGPTPIAKFDPRLSYNFGTDLIYSFSSRIQGQLEFGFAEKGAKLLYPGSNKPVSFKSGYITSSAAIKIMTFKRLFFDIGPEIGFLIYNKKREEDGLVYNVIDKAEKKFEFSGVIGIEYVIWRDLSIFLKFKYSFTPLFDGIVAIDPGPSQPYKIYNEQLSFGGFFLFKKR